MRTIAVLTVLAALALVSSAALADCKSDAKNLLAVSGPCLAAKPSTTYRYGARFRRVSGETYVCGPQIHHYADAACKEPLGHLAAMADLLETEWQAFDPARRPEAGPDQGVARTEATTRAIQLVFACSGAPGFVVRFDDVFVSAP